MIEAVIKTSNIIRKIFEQVPVDGTLTNDLLKYSRDLINYIDKERNIEYKKEAYMTLGIAFAIQTLLIKNEAVSFYLKRKIIFFSLRQLLRGVIEYENKYWKAECAFWSIFVICNNELYTNDILCDTLQTQGKRVTNDNVILLKFHIISCLFDFTIERDSAKNTFTPLFNERNGLNADKVLQFYYKWTDEGWNAICRDKSLLEDDKKVLDAFINVIEQSYE